MKYPACPVLFMCCLVPLTAAGGVQGAAEATGKPIVIGHERTIVSERLGEARTVRVALPDNYAESQVPCGVLYLLDGESLFIQAVGAVRHASPNDVLPMIVVGIDNTERTRDLTPPAGEEQAADFPTSGGSASFRRFLVDELRPMIDAEYRTGSVRVLAGHSFGGLFTAETLLTEPAAFTGYLALSPSFWWNDRAFVKTFTELPVDHGMFDRFAFFGMGEEDGLMNGPFEEVIWGLKRRAPAGFRWKHQIFPGQDHWPAALPALGAGIKEFFSPIREMSTGVMTFAELERKGKEVSAMFGQEIPVGRDAVADASYALNLRGDHDGAIALIDDALKVLTDEPYFYFARANILGGNERYAEAMETLERGIQHFSKAETHGEAVAAMKRSLVEFKGKLK